MTIIRHVDYIWGTWMLLSPHNYASVLYYLNLTLKYHGLFPQRGTETTMVDPVTVAIYV